MKSIQFGVLALLHFSFPALVQACDLEDFEYDWVAYDIEMPEPWLDSPGVGFEGRFEVGNLDGDDRLDLVYLSGGELWVGIDVAEVEKFTTLTEVDVIDFALLPGADSMGRDLIVVTSEAGLTAYAWEDSSSQLAQASSSLPSWANASALSVWSDSSSGQVLLCGLSADGRNVLEVEVLSQDFVELPGLDLVDLVSPAHSVQKLDWDGQNEIDYLVVTEDEVIVLDKAGMRLLETSLYTAGTDEQAIVVPKMNGALDGFYWITGVEDSYYGVSLTSSWYEPLHTLGDERGASLHLADYDGDGYQDLLVSCATRYEAWRLKGSVGGPTKNTFNLDITETAHFSFPTLGTPVGAIRPIGIRSGDFDGDGDVDLLMLQADASSFRLCKNEELFEGEEEAAITWLELADPIAGALPLNLTFEIPDFVATGGGSYSLRYELWGQEELGDPLSATPLIEREIALTSSMVGPLSRSESIQLGSLSSMAVFRMRVRIVDDSLVQRRHHAPFMAAATRHPSTYLELSTEDDVFEVTSPLDDPTIGGGSGYRSPRIRRGGGSGE